MVGVSFNTTDDKNGATFIVNSDDTNRDSVINVQQYSDAHGFISDDGSITISYEVLREIYLTLRKLGFPG